MSSLVRIGENREPKTRGCVLISFNKKKLYFF